MSGGSFNYLCYQDEPKLHDLQDMAKELRKRGMDDAAEETESIIANAPSEELRDLWHAVEWHVSNDWGPDRVIEVYDRWAKGAPPPKRKLKDAFIRARNPDGTIQIGFADQGQPYGERSVEIMVVDRKQAGRLAIELVIELTKGEPK